MAQAIGGRHARRGSGADEAVEVGDQLLDHGAEHLRTTSWEVVVQQRLRHVGLGGDLLEAEVGVAGPAEQQPGGAHEVRPALVGVLA